MSLLPQPDQSGRLSSVRHERRALCCASLLTADCPRPACLSSFLRGTCRSADCLFSHKTIPEKVPVCEFFLRGICTRDACPYRHVNVGRTASICHNFARLGQCYEKDVS